MMYTKEGISNYLVDELRERKRSELYAFEAYSSLFLRKKFSALFEANKDIYVDYLTSTMESMSNYQSEDADNYSEFFYNNETIFENVDLRVRFLPSDVKEIRPEYLDEFAVSVRSKIKKIVAGTLTDAKVYAKREYGDNFKRKLATVTFKYKDDNIHKLKFDHAERVKLTVAFVKNNIYPFLDKMNDTKVSIIADAKKIIKYLNTSYDSLAATYDGLNSVLDKHPDLDAKTLKELNDFTYYVNQFYMQACAYVTYALIRRANTFQYNLMMIDRIYSRFSSIYEFATESTYDGDISTALNDELIAALTGSANLDITNRILDQVVAKNRNYVASAISSINGYTEPEVLDQVCVHYMYKDPNYAKLAAAYDSVSGTAAVIADSIYDQADNHEGLAMGRSINIRGNIDYDNAEWYINSDFNYRPDDTDDSIPNRLMRRYAELVQCRDELTKSIESAREAIKAIDEKMMIVGNAANDPECDNPVTVAETLRNLSLYKKEFEEKQAEVGRFFIDRLYKIQSEIVAITAIVRAHDGIQLESFDDDEIPGDSYIVENAVDIITEINDMYTIAVSEMYKEFESELYYRRTGKRIIFEADEQQNQSQPASTPENNPKPTESTPTKPASTPTNNVNPTQNQPTKVSKSNFIKNLKDAIESKIDEFIRNVHKYIAEARHTMVIEAKGTMLNMDYSGVTISIVPYQLKTLDTMKSDIDKVSNNLSNIPSNNLMTYNVENLRKALFNFIPTDGMTMDKGAKQSQLYVKWYTLGRNKSVVTDYKDAAAKSIVQDMYSYIENYGNSCDQLESAFKNLESTIERKVNEIYDMRPATVQNESAFDYFEMTGTNGGDNNQASGNGKPSVDVKDTQNAGGSSGNVADTKDSNNSNGTSSNSSNPSELIKTECRSYMTACMAAAERVYYEYIFTLNKLGTKKGIIKLKKDDNNKK